MTDEEISEAIDKVIDRMKENDNCPQWESLRLYCFGNMYLSSIQQGIQGLHALGLMIVNYEHPNEIVSLGCDSDEDCKRQREYHQSCSMIYEWMEYHKTVICLNGGTSDNLYDIHNTFYESYKYPSAVFEEEGIGNAMTSVAVILPDYVYDSAALMRKYQDVDDKVLNLLTDEDFRIIDILNSCGLAK